MKSLFKFCFGPWNIGEGADPYGPPVRASSSFDWKLEQLHKLGFEVMMFHDDPKARRCAIERSLRAIEIAKLLGTRRSSSYGWLAREPTCVKQKIPASRDTFLGHKNALD